MMRAKLFVASAFAFSTVLAACNDSSGTAAGKLTVQLTDAPFPFDQVARVDVFVIRIDAKSADTDSAAAAAESDMGGWVTIATPNKAIDLLTLRGGVTTNLGTASLSSGTYRGFRMIIDAAKSSITLKDGSQPAIKWPSATRTGIKINLDKPIVVAADSSVMILDFDIGRSFVLRGASISQNGLLFKPVIRAIAKELTGSVTGSVRANTATGPVVAGASVEVLKAGTALGDTVSANVVRTTSTDVAGAFRLTYLLPGTYVLRATPPASSGFKAALLPGGLTIQSSIETSGQVIIVAP